MILVAERRPTPIQNSPLPLSYHSPGFYCISHHYILIVIIIFLSPLHPLNFHYYTHNSLTCKADNGPSFQFQTNRPDIELDHSLPTRAGCLDPVRSLRLVFPFNSQKRRLSALLLTPTHHRWRYKNEIILREEELRNLQLPRRSSAIRISCRLNSKFRSPR